METRPFKKGIYLGFLLFFVVMGCRSDEAGRPPSLEPQAAVFMNDSIYSADSLRVAMMHEKRWFFYNFGFRKDSLPEICAEAIQVVEPLLEYRVDTFLALAYGDFIYGEGIGLAVQGFPYQGLEKMDEAYAVISRYENGMFLRRLCHAIAFVHEGLGDFEKSLAYIRKAYHYSNQHFKKWHYYFANSQSNIANAYWRSGDLERAYAEALKVLDMTKERDPRYYNRYLLDVSEILLDWNRPDVAAPYLAEFQKTRPLRDTFHHYSSFAVIIPRYHYLKGRMELQAGALDPAIRDLDKALEISRQPSPEHAVFVDEIRSNVWLEKARYFAVAGQREKALEAFENAAKLALQSHSTIIPFHKASIVAAEKARYLLDIGSNEESLRASQGFLAFLFSDLDSAEVLQNPDPKQIASYIYLLPLIELKARAFNALWAERCEPEHLRQSFATYSLALKALEIAQFQFRTPDSKKWAQERTAPLTEGALLAALALYEEAERPEYLAEAFLLIQRKKGNTLLGRMQEVKAKSFSDIPAEIREREAELQNQVAYYQRMIDQESRKTLELRDSVVLSKWESYHLDALLALDSIHDALQSRFPRYRRMQENLELATVQDIQQYLLKENAALLEYFLGDSTLLIFGLNGREVFFHRAAYDERLEEGLQSFQRLVSRPNEQQLEEEMESYAALGKELHDRLILPAGGILDQPNLIIIPDGRLGYLPFHLLLRGAAVAGQPGYRAMPYLFRRYTIRYEYAASLLLQNWKRPKTEHSYAGFAPAYKGDELLAMRGQEDSLLIAGLFEEGLLREGLSALKNNQSEVAFAAAAMKGLQYHGEEALESRFKLVAPRSHILHLAMHALTNDREPMYSQLIFSREPDGGEDGKLHAYELYNMNLNADLAVLSACETGAGKVQNGEGVMSLSHAFKYAGCPNVVMSLWKAHDRSAAMLIQYFFSHLKKGVGKAEALNRARADFLKLEDERYAHPFYWGGMVMVGG